MGFGNREKMNVAELRGRWVWWECGEIGHECEMFKRMLRISGCERRLRFLKDVVREE